MARSDLLKRLFEAYQRRDDRSFRLAANDIIDDERKKHHTLVANELQRILSNGVRSMEALRGTTPVFDPVPMDSERRTPLLTVRTPERYFEDLVLEPSVRTSFERVLREVRGWEILEANALAPTRRLLLCGPSGCGKTASAEALAAELARRHDGARRDQARRELVPSAPRWIQRTLAHHCGDELRTGPRPGDLAALRRRPPPRPAEQGGAQGARDEAPPAAPDEHQAGEWAPLEARRRQLCRRRTRVSRRSKGLRARWQPDAAHGRCRGGARTLRVSSSDTQAGCSW